MNKKEQFKVWDLSRRLFEMAKHHGQGFWDELFRLVWIDQHLGSCCECGRKTVLLNVMGEYYVYCKKCNTYWSIGKTGFDCGFDCGGDWTASDWVKKILRKARRIEPKYRYLSLGHKGLMYDKWQAIQDDCRNCRAKEERPDYNDILFEEGNEKKPLTIIDAMADPQPFDPRG